MITVKLKEFVKHQAAYINRPGYRFLYFKVGKDKFSEVVSVRKSGRFNCAPLNKPGKTYAIRPFSKVTVHYRKIPGHVRVMERHETPEEVISRLAPERHPSLAERYRTNEITCATFKNKST